MPYFKYKNSEIYYEERGSGLPLLLLHGNSASSKMFDSILNLYINDFRIILIDFLGCGKSHRILDLPLELWFEEAYQVIELIEYLDLNQINILGSSGGAWVALNVALERPDLVDKIILDSFDGRNLVADFSTKLKGNRYLSKQDKKIVDFYKFCHGDDWETVVDNDTNSILKFISNKCHILHKNLNQLKSPVLITASTMDSLIRNDYLNEYISILNEVEQGQIHIFKNGDHPSLISNPFEFAFLVKSFLNTRKFL